MAHKPAKPAKPALTRIPKRTLTPEEDRINGTIISVLQRAIDELSDLGMPDDAICVGLLNAVVSHAYRSQCYDPETLAKSFHWMAEAHDADRKEWAELAVRLVGEANDVP